MDRSICPINKRNATSLLISSPIERATDRAQEIDDNNINKAKHVGAFNWSIANKYFGRGKSGTKNLTKSQVFSGILKEDM